jgi:hypothetical protein
MKKRLTMALAAGALMAAMVPGVTSATPGIGGCSDGIPPVLMSSVDVTGKKVVGPRDLNGDGLICEWYLDPMGKSPVEPRGIMLFLDNVVKRKP